MKDFQLPNDKNLTISSYDSTRRISDHFSLECELGNNSFEGKNYSHSKNHYINALKICPEDVKNSKKYFFLYQNLIESLAELGDVEELRINLICVIGILIEKRYLLVAKKYLEKYDYILQKDTQILFLKTKVSILINDIQGIDYNLDKINKMNKHHIHQSNINSKDFQALKEDLYFFIKNFYLESGYLQSIRFFIIDYYFNKIERKYIIDRDILKNCKNLLYYILDIMLMTDDFTCILDKYLNFLFLTNDQTIYPLIGQFFTKRVKKKLQTETRLKLLEKFKERKFIIDFQQMKNFFDKKKSFTVDKGRDLKFKKENQVKDDTFINHLLVKYDTIFNNKVDGSLSKENELKNFEKVILSELFTADEEMNDLGMADLLVMSQMGDHFDVVSQFWQRYIETIFKVKGVECQKGVLLKYFVIVSHIKMGKYIEALELTSDLVNNEIIGFEFKNDLLIIEKSILNKMNLVTDKKIG